MPAARPFLIDGVSPTDGPGTGKSAPVEMGAAEPNTREQSIDEGWSDGSCLSSGGKA